MAVNSLAEPDTFASLDLLLALNSMCSGRGVVESAILYKSYHFDNGMAII